MREGNRLRTKEGITGGMGLTLRMCLPRPGAADSAPAPWSRACGEGSCTDHHLRMGPTDSAAFGSHPCLCDQYSEKGFLHPAGSASRACRGERKSQEGLSPKQLSSSPPASPHPNPLVEQPGGGAPSRVHSIVLVFPRLAKQCLMFSGKEKRGNYLMKPKEKDGAVLDVRKNFPPACKEKAFLTRYN